MNNSTVVQVSGLAKTYGKKEVLRVDSLKVHQGSITGIIGPSGAGKTTLLRILNLLEPPTRGEINYFGLGGIPSVPSQKLALQRRMKMVFQKPVLLDISVYENVAFGLRACGISRQETRERVESILVKIGMDHLARQKAKTLSGGEAQRVVFGRAFVMEPEILFLDEPTANLDPANVELLENMIAGLNRESGATVIMVTHNLFQARRLCTDIAFLYQGSLIETGKTGSIFQEPSREETRAFIEGRMIY